MAYTNLVNVFKLKCKSKNIAEQILFSWLSDTRNFVAYQSYPKIPYISNAYSVDFDMFIVDESVLTITLTAASDKPRSNLWEFDLFSFLCFYKLIYNLVNPMWKKGYQIIYKPMKIIYQNDPTIFFTITTYGQVLFGSSNYPDCDISTKIEKSSNKPRINSRELTVNIQWEFKFSENIVYKFKYTQNEIYIIYYIYLMALYTDKYKSKSVLKLLDYKYIPLMFLTNSHLQTQKKILTLKDFSKFFNITQEDKIYIASNWEYLVQTSVNKVQMLVMLFMILDKKDRLCIAKSNLIKNLNKDPLKSIIISLKILEIPEVIIIENMLQDILESCLWSNIPFQEYDLYKYHSDPLMMELPDTVKSYIQNPLERCLIHYKK